MNPFKKLTQRWQRGNVTVDRTADGRVEMEQTDDYAGLHPDIRPVDHSVVEMFDEDRTLEEVAQYSPNELSYVEWTALANQRGVELGQLPEYTALPVEERPLTIEGENERAERQEAFIESSYENDWSRDRVRQVDETAQQVLDQDFSNGAAPGRIVPFEYQGERLYVRDHGRGEFQVLTGDEAGADPEWNAGRVEDVSAARLQAIDEDAEIEADLAMPRPPTHDVGGAYESMWKEAAQISRDRYDERVGELEFSHGCDAGEVRDDKERRLQLHQEELEREYELKQQARREAERDGIELSPF